MNGPPETPLGTSRYLPTEQMMWLAAEETPLGTSKYLPTEQMMWLTVEETHTSRYFQVPIYRTVDVADSGNDMRSTKTFKNGTEANRARYPTNLGRCTYVVGTYPTVQMV